MAEVPCAGTGEKSIEKGDAAVILHLTSEAPHGPANHLRQGLRHRGARRFPGDAGSAALRPAHAMPSTASSRPPTTISGTRWTRTTSTSTSRSTWPTTPIMPLRHGGRAAGAPSPTGWTTARRSSSPTTSCTGRSRTCCTASRARCRCRPASATSCSIRARRNTPPTRPARRRATSRPSPATSPALGRAAAGRQDHRHGCWPTWSSTPGGLQEDRRHADAGRGPGDGRLRHAQRQDQRSGAAPAGAAGDERRGLPPPLRQASGRPSTIRAAERGGAQEGRGLGGADASRRCCST